MGNMVDIEYDCKCGARVTGKAERQFTPEEIAELSRRGCDKRGRVTDRLIRFDY